MNTDIKKWVSLFTVIAILLMISVSGLNVTGYAQSEEDYVSLRNSLIKALDEANKLTTEDRLKKAIDAFFALPSLDDYPDSNFVDDKQIFLDEILILLTLVIDESKRHELHAFLATEALNTARETAHHLDLNVADKVIINMSPGKEKDMFIFQLEQVKNEIFEKMQSDYIDWYNLPENLDIDPYVPPEEDALAYEDVYDGEIETQEPISNYDRISSRYEVQGKVCQKITDYFKDGQLVETRIEAVSNEEKVFCGFSNEKSQFNFDSSGNAFQWVLPDTSHDKENIDLNPYNQQAPDTNKTKESAITIHYIFKNNSNLSYYYDSGIKINEDKTLSYDQAKNALYHIAIHTKGKFAEDKDKALALIDGTIILLMDNGKAITIEEFADLFMNTSVTVDALRTQSRITFSDLIKVEQNY